MTVHLSSNPKLEEARKDNNMIDNIDLNMLKKYASAYPLTNAAEDDTEHLNDILYEVLAKCYAKLIAPKRPINDDRIQKAADIKTLIAGIEHHIIIEYSVMTDTILSYLINIRLTKYGRDIGNPSHQIFGEIILARDTAGSVGMIEKFHFEIDPTPLYPETVIASYIGEPIAKFWGTPMGEHPAMQCLRVGKIKNRGPYSGKNYMATGRFTRDPKSRLARSQ